MFTQSTSSPLINDSEIESWVRTMFGGSLPGTDGVRLVVKIGGKTITAEDSAAHGGTTDEATRDAIRELTQSLAMYGLEQPGDAAVARPSADRIGRALAVLSDPAARRQTLGAALNIFGKRVIAPLERVLSSGTEGTTARLLVWRNAVVRDLEALRLTHETSTMLRGDLQTLLSEDYLAMLGDNEEKFLRPRLTELAHRVMDVLAGTFHRALDRFAAHAERIADRIVRRLPVSMALRDVPGLLKSGFVTAVAEFLEVETSTELTGALQTLSAQYRDVTPAEEPLSFVDTWFRDVGEACWDVIVMYC